MPDEEQNEDLRSGLARLWASGKRREFYRRAVAEAVPAIRGLVIRELGMRPEDAEDCVGEALEAFFSREEELETGNPFAYLATSALNAGRTVYRRRKRLDEELAAAMGGGGGYAGMSPEWAVIAVEEAVIEVEADESWAVEVLELAMEKLGPRQREVVRYLAAQDFDYQRRDLAARSAEGGAALGMSAPAFRKAKERAYARLKVEIPAAVESLGIEPPERFVGAFEESAGKFMEEEEG